MPAPGPWTKLMPAPYFEAASPFSHGLDMFESTLATRRDAVAIRYFDGVLTYGDLDNRSTTLANILAARGFAAGDRLAVFLQNVPAFVVAMLAAWKLGGAFMPINPMNRTTELRFILDDAKPHTLILSPFGYRDVFAALPPGFNPAVVMSTSPFADQSRNDLRVLPEAERNSPAGVENLEALIREQASGSSPALARDPAAPGFLVYTSGTTGVPKAAVISQSAIGFASTLAKPTYDLADGATILAIAPLFHMTGLMSTLVSSLFLGGDLILTYRFAPETTLEAIAQFRPSFTAAAPTALIALMQVAGDDEAVFKCFHAVAVGGAPIPPTVVASLKARFGVTGQTGYGLTETAGAVILTPYALADAVPTAELDGPLSIGVPCAGIHVWVADDQGNPLPPGEQGELMVESPANMTSYWARPEGTAEAFKGPALKTGDIGFMNADGWFFLVDRKKDVIIASGFKVWPREIEDVLYHHPDILEAAVVGAPDAYRGETVQAYVRLRPNSILTEIDVKAYARAKLAAYKCPASVFFVDDLPKTNTGKIMRRALRAEV